jgi:phenylpyruvate tautomerase PptA (4-oxalocrotonate tautomerase family)
MLGAMPLVKLFTSADPLPPERATALLEALSARLAKSLSKPESYVMTCLMPQTQMTFAGNTDQPSCYLEVKNIGTLSPIQTRALSAELTAEVCAAFGVPPERTYIEFNDAQPHLWGHAGETFD